MVSHNISNVFNNYEATGLIYSLQVGNLYFKLILFTTLIPYVTELLLVKCLSREKRPLCLFLPPTSNVSIAAFWC